MADAGLSEGNGNLTCGDFANDFSCACNLSGGGGSSKAIEAKKSGTCQQNAYATCADFLPLVNIKFELDPGDNGAEFEAYPNPNNPAEVGYRTCADECSVIIAGRCKAPSPSPSEVVTVTVTVTPTPTATPTATITPTPTPTPVCNYYKGSLDSVNDKKNGWKDFKSTNNTGLSCVDQKIQQFTNACRGWRYAGYYDDCIATKFSDTFFGGLNQTNSKSKYAWNVNTGYYKEKLKGNASVKYGTCTAADFFIHSGGKACLSGYFYFDQNCNGVSEDKVKEVCGDLQVTFKSTFLWSTPISLIWDKDFNLDSEVAFTKFNLDLGNGETAWYAWKASDKAPLLVYDPNHSGEVKDASQLFGNWTFGGKRVASLASGSEISSGKWANGYEALASLDRDFDGKLSSDELSDLALWFDANRDGVSQKGEVKTLKEVAVTSLYFNGYKTDANGDLRLDVGFTRTVDGVAQNGASIDWQEVGAPSKLALADYFSTLSSKTASDYDMAIEHELASTPTSPFAGVWKWYIDEKDATEDSPSSGAFIMSVAKDNQIKGYTLAERRFSASPDSQLNSFVTMNRIAGEEKDNVLRFSAQSGNSFTDNEATLSADGKTMTGKTTVVIANGAAVSYGWKAMKSNLK